jgi:ribonuclease PH
MARIDGRKNNQLRSVKMIPDFLEYPHGSIVIQMGKTRVLCTAMIETGVPKFLKGKGTGWLTAEYGMLPASTPERSTRDAVRGKVDGRSQEIQRLVGRSLRSITEMNKLGEKTIWIDCDVLQADGGTRTAAITGSFVAVQLAVKKAIKQGIINESPIRENIAAVSVGIVNGIPMLDLCYEEDSSAEVDMNFVMTEGGKFIEIQGTAERDPFSKQDLAKLLSLAENGIKKLIKIQKEVLGK